MNDSVRDDSLLWDHLIEGDEEAYSALFRKYYQNLISYGNSLTDHQNLVPDCVQDVFIELWIYRANLSHPVSVKAYLLAGVRKRIARKLERDHVFRNKQDLEQLPFTRQFTVLDKMISDEETASNVNQLNKLLNQLPDRQREALYLRFHQELGIDQIAELMQINTQSASNLIHRAIKHLRSFWVGELHTLTLLLYSVYELM